MDVLFDLFKTDLASESSQQEETINMGKFLAVRTPDQSEKRKRTI
jgi:hypothetical protein